MKSVLHTKDFSMHYAVFGNGPKAFVILPGLSLTHTSDYEDAVAARYAPMLEQCTFYLLDRREEPDESTTIHTLAEDSYAALQTLGIKHAVVFGASQGGMMALDLVVHHPDFVTGLILCSSTSGYPKYLRECSEKWLDMARRQDMNGLNASFVDWMYSERFLQSNRKALLSASKSYTEKELRHFANLVRALGTLDLTGNLAPLRCPVLVIGAEQDRVMGVDASRELAQGLQCECHIYGDGYAHAVYDEAPDFIERISAFVSGLEAKNA